MCTIPATRLDTPYVLSALHFSSAATAQEVTFLGWLFADLFDQIQLRKCPNEEEEEDLYESHSRKFAVCPECPL